MTKNACTLLLGLLIMVACSQEKPKDYLTFSGKLENNKDSILAIANRQGIIKEIKIGAEGTFKDTLKLKSDKGEIYTLQTAVDKVAPIYLKNGFDITLNGNSDNFMESFKYSGNGASNSNFILAQIKKGQSIGNPQLILNLDEKAFRKKIEDLKTDYDSILNAYNNLDSTLYATVKQQNEQLVTYFNNAYEQSKVMGKGKPSPKFKNYINIKGGKMSLDDFKGKYVYIDVWATWCGPCIQQIPYLKTLEEDYHNKNIEFVSISTDESRRSGGSWEAAEQKWRDFVEKRNLSGVQLWSGKDYSFQQAYQINAIPRFILIDPEGNIVNANAPRPSDPQLKSLFTSLGI
ncbi:TlpA family protein disulfide reductase [Polaribacter sp. M15]